MIALYQRGDLGDSTFAFANAPKLVVSSAHIKTDSNEDARRIAPSNTVAIVATFKKRAAAEQAYAGLIGKLPSNGEGVLFGHTVYLRLPVTNMSARAALFEECNNGTTNTFVERTNYGGSFTLQFDLPKEKRTAEWYTNFSDYWMFNGSYQLIPPWAAESEKLLTGEHIRARRTLQLLNHAQEEPTEKRKANEAEESDRKAIAQAVRIGDTEKVERLQKQIRDRIENRRKQRLEGVKKMPETEVHRTVIESYMDYPSDTNKLAAYKASQEKLRTLLGSVKDSDSEAWRYSSDGGFLLDTKENVTIHLIQFNDFPRGGPALINWLESHGAQKILYRVDGSFRNTGGGGSDEEE